ncbi:hypothetical protein GE09DRAFT_1173204 [Coniochaeta sp. 2T2.1]|nr:hypothetical protein GE09DRAFT_1173204 [Coniochaeta sp. 2T2.1]
MSFGFSIGDIITVVEFANKIRKQFVDDEDRRKVLDWLTPIDYAATQADLINRRQEGTGQWLLDSTEFQTWLQTKKQTMFCPGIPRAGKTILASIVADELVTRFRDDETVGVAYVYCNFRQTHEQRLSDLVASLIRQLSQGLSDLPNSVRLLQNRYKKRQDRPPFKELSETLRIVTAAYEHVYIIVDALDECQTTEGCRQQFLAEVFDLVNQLGVRFFTTSRFIPEITHNFQGWTTLEIRASPEDVRKYVEGQNLAPTIIRRSFLLAKLHLDSLVGKRSPKAVRTALGKLPSGSDAYDHASKNAMERIEGQLADQEELAKQVLAWITCAARPLSITEIQHALAVEVGTRELDQDNLPDLEDLVSVCAGLVAVDEESHIIRLAHYTTQEYFARTKEHWFPSAEILITDICATYLAFDAFASGRCEHRDISKRLREHPMYDYAAHNWGYHARKAQTCSNHVIDFLLRKKEVEAASQIAISPSTWLSRSPVPRDGGPSNLAGIHLAVTLELDEAVKALLREGVHPSQRDGDRLTPLNLAAYLGLVSIVKMLLDHGSIDLNTHCDRLSETPLLSATMNGHLFTVKTLLESPQVDVEAKDGSGRTPLSRAVTDGRYAILRLLLDSGRVDRNSRDTFGYTPLMLAALGDQEAIMIALLGTRDIDAELPDHAGRTPLSMAAGFVKLAAVKLLLGTANVDPDSRDNLKRIP